MQTIPTGGRQLIDSDFLVRFGDEPALGGLPLRQTWRLLAGACAAPCAPQWRDADGERAKFAIFPRGAEGEIWALNERALDAGRQVVDDAHGGAVHFAVPTVHTYIDPVRRVPMQPLMLVKVHALREHLDAILRKLRSRGARMQEIELQGRVAIMRAEMGLAALLGFETELMTTSIHSARMFAWLVRYEAVIPGIARSWKE